MKNNVSYLNCRSCGRLLHKDKFKSGYCPPCLRGRIAAVHSLYDEAVRMIDITEEVGIGSQAWGESQAFCRIVMEKIIQAEAETGQSLFDGEDIAFIDAFMRRGVDGC